jgi:hypothetical protein
MGSLPSWNKWRKFHDGVKWQTHHQIPRMCSIIIDIDTLKALSTPLGEHC